MKEVALYDAKNGLSALVQEVEDTGEAILITRHGKPAAKLTPVEAPAGRQRVAALRRLLELREDTARRFPDTASVPWETLKAWVRDEDDDAV